MNFDLNNSYYYYFYNYFYSSKNIVNLTPTIIKQSQSFLKSCSEKTTLQSLGTNWLFKYLIFQFEYWSNIKITSFNNKISFSFIFGEKAIERFFNRKEEFDWQLTIESSFLVKNKNIDYFTFLSFLDESKKSVESYPHPVKLKQKLNLCLIFTTLYDHTDNSCIFCIERKECKTILEKNYSLIYKDRYGRKKIVG